MSPLLSVDWGTRHIGLAVSDPLRCLARPLPTLSASTPSQALHGVIQAAKETGVKEVLMGLPLHMNGEEGVSARKARRLGDSLEKEGFLVIYHDERLSSEEARDLLRQQGDSRPKKTRVDQMAALVLLQNYLDTNP